MKKLLIPIVAGFAALLPVSSLRAADPAATYGGLVPGQTFTMTVTDASSVRTRGTNADHDVPVPDGWPDLKEGDSVQFVIGNRGQLTGPGFSISYKSEKNNVNLYSNNPSFSSPRGEAAAITKNDKDKPRVVRLTFYKLHFSGLIPITNTVTYKLEK